MTYLRRRGKSIDVIIAENKNSEPNETSYNHSSVFSKPISKKTFTPVFTEEMATTPGDMASFSNNNKKIGLCGTLPFCDNSAKHHDKSLQTMQSSKSKFFCILFSVS